MSGSELIAVIGSAASALAAAAAWAAVRQGREMVRAARRPRLVAVHLEAQDGTVQFMIENAGQGTALAAWCTFVSSGRVFGGLIGEGIVRAGERFRLRTAVPSTGGDAQGVLWCVDGDGVWWAWSFDGNEKRWRRSPELNPQGYVHQFYPSLYLDLDRLAMPMREMGFERATP